MAYDYRSELERLQEKLSPRLAGSSLPESLRYTNLPSSLKVYDPEVTFTQPWQLERLRGAAGRYVEAGLWTEQDPYYKYMTSRKLGEPLGEEIPELKRRPGENYYDYVQR